MLELVSIRKRFGSFLLGDISLTINDGEYFVLLGPSGVGKTVLLEIIAGLVPPDKGTLLHNGADITRLAPEHRGFGLLYQDYALFPHLTVRRNITYGLDAAGTSAPQTRHRLDALTQMLHIDSLLDKRPSILSGGQQQRVALARALAVQPKLLLLDEPLNACDLNTRIQLRRELKRITGQLGIAALHVTHDPEEAISLGDRIAVMIQGRIPQIAPPAELFRSPSRADVASFLGMSNILPVTAVSTDGSSVCGHTVMARGADNSTSYIWIKPEEILLSTTPFQSSARNQFNCRVTEINRLTDLVEVNVVSGSLELTSLITYRSLDTLHLAPGTEVYVTFKSSAVHCF